MVESVSQYFKRSAERERQIAAETADPALRRIHLRKAESLDQRAAESK